VEDQAEMVSNILMVTISETPTTHQLSKTKTKQTRKQLSDVDIQQIGLKMSQKYNSKKQMGKLNAW